MLRVAVAVARRPALWLTAGRQLLAMAPPRWWSRPPYLPVPDRQYRRFRALTHYGDPDRALEPRDVLAWLAWCREHREITVARGEHR